MSLTGQHSNIDERTPLVAAPEDGPQEPNGLIGETEPPIREHAWDSDSRLEESKPWWYLFLVTISIGGLQIVWSVELGSGSPYLLSLGLSKSVLAFVWIAGPLTGALVQPYVGIRSDNCRISWGRRKPFMIGGGAATIISLLCLSRARDIVGGISSIFGGSKESDGVKLGAIIFATAWMYILDFAINAVQAAIRAFIVDNAPAHQQEDANAWASILTGIGNVLGYTFGYIDLPKIMPFFGTTQFEVLSVLASLSLGCTLLMSCLLIKEIDPNLWGAPDTSGAGLISFFKQTFKSIRGLQPQVRKVCEVQLASWMAWFPFLYYMTTYIGQLYVNPYLEENEKNPHYTDRDIDELWEEGTRIGTFALLVYAFTSFAANVILPFLVVPTYKPDNVERINHPTSPIETHPHTPGERPALQSANSTTSASVFIPQENVTTPAKISAWLSRALSYLQIPGLTLRRLWILAEILYAGCMFSTFFITTPKGGSVITGLIGISWSVTLWAPFALISAEIARTAEHRRRKYRKRLAQQAFDTRKLNNGSASSSDERTQEIEEEEVADGSDQAGIILGLHNVAISTPQIFATVISSFVFKALQKPRGTPGDDSVGWVLRLGGIAALVAAYLTTRLKEDTSDEAEDE